MLKTVPASDAVKETKTLLSRIQRYLDDGSLLAFTSNYEIPPTNNWSEQPLRPIKVWQRSSGTRRSVVDAKAGLRCAGYLDTARKNNKNQFVALRTAMEGNPYTPQE